MLTRDATSIIDTAALCGDLTITFLLRKSSFSLKSSLNDSEANEESMKLERLEDVTEGVIIGMFERDIIAEADDKGTVDGTDVWIDGAAAGIEGRLVKGIKEGAREGIEEGIADGVILVMVDGTLSLDDFVSIEGDGKEFNDDLSNCLVEPSGRMMGDEK